jgi:ribosomal protein S24E
MTFKNEKFPSRSFITEKAAEFSMTVKSNVVILSIQEISGEDFDNYNT